MIHAILTKLSKYLWAHEQGQHNWNKYDALRSHEGWQVHQGLLIEIMNEISTYMLSNDFTKLEKEEKDIQQRAFYMVKEIVNFLLDPLKDAKKYAAWMAVNKKGAKSPRRTGPKTPGGK